MTTLTLDNATRHGEARPRPRLATGHSTLAARNLSALQAFYCDVLGFEVTNAGPVPEQNQELVFLSQDPTAHHQIAMVGGAMTSEADFVMVDHLAFRTGTLDDLRIIHANLVEAGIGEILKIDHGNAWSLYFNDPEGNGVETYVDTPFHVAQPYAGTWDITASDGEIERTTRATIENKPEFMLMKDWSANMAGRLRGR
ncbi:VOC family protein [Sphingomonas sp.]|uniref:VOC family protein n=1 Tax=Sphingomonas sp. TaxID=28214 RepID=UPI0025EACD6D|nr:VOC family protein [Sphingomonas sp.]